jgi:hypothetical protein
MGKEYELMIALEVARKRFALIIKALDRHDVFSRSSFQAIEKTKPPEGSGLGPNNKNDGSEIVAIQQ